MSNYQSAIEAVKKIKSQAGSSWDAINPESIA